MAVKLKVEEDSESAKQIPIEIHPLSKSFYFSSPLF